MEKEAYFKLKKYASFVWFWCCVKCDSVNNGCLFDSSSSIVVLISVSVKCRLKNWLYARMI